MTEILLSLLKNEVQEAKNVKEKDDCAQNHNKQPGNTLARIMDIGNKAVNILLKMNQKYNAKTEREKYTTTAS